MQHYYIEVLNFEKTNEEKTTRDLPQYWVGQKSKPAHCCNVCLLPTYFIIFRTYRPALSEIINWKITPLYILDVSSGKLVDNE